MANIEVAKEASLENRRDADPTSVELSSENDAEARQQMAACKLRALLQTDKTKDPEIRRLLKTLSAFDVAKQLGLL